MRIVHHFTQIRRSGGGVPRAVIELVRLLCGGDHQVSLLTAPSAGLRAVLREDEIGNLEVVELDRAGPFELLPRSGLRRVSEVLRQADVLHLHGLWRPRNSQIAALARRLGTPYVLSPHGMLNYWATASRWAVHKAAYFHLLERRNLTSARFVHATAAPEHLTARRWVAEDRLRVIPLVLDAGAGGELPGPDRFAEAHPAIAPDVPRVLMLGRLHPHKRPELLIEAIAGLRRSGLSCQLLFAGTGEASFLARLRQLAARHGVAGATHFLGLVDGSMKRSLYQYADVLALPTIRENFGLVLFESLACGTPVVTTRGADTWKEVERSGGGRLAEPTAAAFSSALGELLRDDRQRARMGRDGQAWVREWLDRRRLRAAYEEMYRQAAGG